MIAETAIALRCDMIYLVVQGARVASGRCDRVELIELSQYCACHDDFRRSGFYFFRCFSLYNNSDTRCLYFFVQSEVCYNPWIPNLVTRCRQDQARMYTCTFDIKTNSVQGGKKSLSVAVTDEFYT